MMTFSLCAIANPCSDGGIGGTGISLDHGIGGTGIINEQVNTFKGIGGTGIVGIITGFGSICVNGLEVHYYENTPVSVDGEKISHKQLAIGQVVAVRATGDKMLVASEIHAYYQVKGPVTGVDTRNGKIKVMGQTVSVQTSEMKALKVGQWVAVSGLRDAMGNVEASRIDHTAAKNHVNIIGNITQRGGNTYLGDTKVVGLHKSAIKPNVDTRLTGVWDGNKVVAKSVDIGPVRELLNKVETFHLQGIAANDAVSGRMSLSKQNVIMSEQTKVLGENNPKNLAGKTVIVRGFVKDNTPIARSIELPRQIFDRKHHDKPSQHIKHERHSSESNDKDVNTDATERHHNVDNHEKVESHEDIEKADKPESIESIEKTEKHESVEKI
ncbi:MAG TPA: DUF5666 domain-containing protein, partial [Methylotenera sp.]|nr:DUF5666 domain-containing protein [Methylotenera sp.]